MRKFSLCLLAIGMFVSSYAQTTTPRQRIFGVHFVLNDFGTANSLRTSGIVNVINSKQWKRTKGMVSGLAVSYMEGLTDHIDFTSSLSGSFLDYPVPGKPTQSQDAFLLEGTAAANIRLLADIYVVNPYLTIGAGASKYKGYYSAFIPAGVGFRVNIFNEAYIIFDAQYRIPVTETAAYHFYYGFGLAGNIGKKK